jgi:hypothetical protein
VITTHHLAVPRLRVAAGQLDAVRPQRLEPQPLRAARGGYAGQPATDQLRRAGGRRHESGRTGWAAASRATSRPIRTTSNVFYAGTNNGRYLDKYNRTHGMSREVNPYPWFYSGEPSSAIRERWQWTFPIIFSKADPRMLFTSSQRLWRTMDGGLTWDNLSPDLTRADPVDARPFRRSDHGT